MYVLYLAFFSPAFVAAAALSAAAASTAAAAASTAAAAAAAGGVGLYRLVDLRKPVHTILQTLWLVCKKIGSHCSTI